MNEDTKDDSDLVEALQEYSRSYCGFDWAAFMLGIMGGVIISMYVEFFNK